jgi:hypothetical protein
MLRPYTYFIPSGRKNSHRGRHRLGRSRECFNCVTGPWDSLSSEQQLESLKHAGSSLRNNECRVERAKRSCRIEMSAARRHSHKVVRPSEHEPDSRLRKVRSSLLYSIKGIFHVSAQYVSQNHDESRNTLRRVISGHRFDRGHSGASAKSS